MKWAFLVPLLLCIRIIHAQTCTQDEVDKCDRCGEINTFNDNKCCTEGTENHHDNFRGKDKLDSSLNPCCENHAYIFKYACDVSCDDIIDPKVEQFLIKLE